MLFIVCIDGPLVIFYKNILDHSHPTMRAGQPFKTRGTGRPYPGVLLTPDILKFKIPIPYAFVPINPAYNPRVSNEHINIEKESIEAVAKRVDDDLANTFRSTTFFDSKECRKTTDNLRKCLQNNSSDNCSYYTNYLSNFCVATARK